MMKIDPAQHGWMTAPETIQVMAALGEARFVGAAVRNALLGLPVVDVDIAVTTPPDEALARLKSKRINEAETFRTAVMAVSTRALLRGTEKKG